MIIEQMTLRRALRARQEPESLHVFANLFWQLLLFVCVALAVAIVGYDAWVYIDVNNSLSANPPTTATDAEEKPPFDRQQLSDIVQTLNERRIQFQLRGAVEPEVVDPSK